MSDHHNKPQLPDGFSTRCKNWLLTFGKISLFPFICLLVATIATAFYENQSNPIQSLVDQSQCQIGSAPVVLLIVSDTASRCFDLQS